MAVTNVTVSKKRHQ